MRRKRILYKRNGQTICLYIYWIFVCDEIVSWSSIIHFINRYQIIANGKLDLLSFYINKEPCLYLDFVNVHENFKRKISLFTRKSSTKKLLSLNSIDKRNTNLNMSYYDFVKTTIHIHFRFCAWAQVDFQINNLKTNHVKFLSSSVVSTNLFLKKCHYIIPSICLITERYGI